MSVENTNSKSTRYRLIGNGRELHRCEQCGCLTLFRSFCSISCQTTMRDRIERLRESGRGLTVRRREYIDEYGVNTSTHATTMITEATSIFQMSLIIHFVQCIALLQEIEVKKKKKRKS